MHVNHTHAIAPLWRAPGPYSSNLLCNRRPTSGINSVAATTGLPTSPLNLKLSACSPQMKSATTAMSSRRERYSTAPFTSPSSHIACSTCAETSGTLSVHFNVVAPSYASAYLRECFASTRGRPACPLSGGSSFLIGLKLCLMSAAAGTAEELASRGVYGPDKGKYPFEGAGLVAWRR